MQRSILDMRRVLTPWQFGALTAGARSCAQQVAKEAPSKPEADSKSEGQPEGGKKSSLGVSAPAGGKRNLTIFSNTTKAVYIHFHNLHASRFWFMTDFNMYFVVVLFLTVGTMMITRIRSGMLTTTVKAQLGENLLDQRTRDLLNDIETLRKKDPLRLENEANAFHEMFWQSRAKAVAEQRNTRRSVEISRGLLQGEARGTDMTEWLGAKAKDDQEREVARRTHDYIQGFHQHLKAKRLI
jgi:hypothetical protein